jgi:hypothetical protein
MVELQMFKDEQTLDRASPLRGTSTSSRRREVTRHLDELAKA